MVNWKESERQRNESTDKLLDSLTTETDIRIVLAWLREQAEYKDIRFADAGSVRRNTLLHLHNDLQERYSLIGR